jgi:hypothetical protein
MRGNLGSFGLVLVLISGCQTARYVHKTGNTGVVAIPADTSAWPFYHRRQAEELMQKQFPQGYVVESEGEEVIGIDTDRNNYGHVNVGGPVSLTVGDVSTRNRTEWRIQYRKK